MAYANMYLEGGTLSSSRRGSGKSVSLRPSQTFQARLAGGALWEALRESVSQGQAVCMAAKARPLDRLVPGSACDSSRPLTETDISADPQNTGTKAGRAPNGRVPGACSVKRPPRGHATPHGAGRLRIGIGHP